MTGPGIALVIAGLVLDLPAALIRLAAASVILGLFHRLDATTDALAALAAFAPLARSLACLVVPVPAPLMVRAATGARMASDREATTLDSVLGLVPGASRPRHLLVVDNPDEDAWVLGETLFLSRGLFDGPHLAAVVAHELGHLAGRDGRVALAAWWLPVRWMSWLAERLLGVRQPGRWGKDGTSPGRTSPGPILAQPQAAGGWTAPHARPARPPGRGVLATLVRLPAMALGAGLLVGAGGLLPMALRPLWAAYRRNRELAADRFAARLGQAPGLIEALADWQLLDVATPWWQGRSHPYVEQRIDRLQAILDGRG